MLGSVPSFMRAELQQRELAHPLADTALAEEDRSRRINADCERSADEERQRQEEQDRCADDVDQPLHELGRAAGFATGGRPTIGSPSTEWMAIFWPITSKSRGTMSICTSWSRSDRIDLHRPFRRLPRESDDDTVDVECAHDLGQRVARPEKRNVLELGPASRRVVIDEADDVDAVLRVLEQLPGDHLADLAGADDHRVLQVEDTLPAEAARAAVRAANTLGIASDQKTASSPRFGSSGKRAGRRARAATPRP